MWILKFRVKIQCRLNLRWKTDAKKWEVVREEAEKNKGVGRTGGSTHDKQNWKPDGINRADIYNVLFLG